MASPKYKIYSLKTGKMTDNPRPYSHYSDDELWGEYYWLGDYLAALVRIGAAIKRAGDGLPRSLPPETVKLAKRWDLKVAAEENRIADVYQVVSTETHSPDRKTGGPDIFTLPSTRESDQQYLDAKERIGGTDSSREREPQLFMLSLELGYDAMIDEQDLRYEAGDKRFNAALRKAERERRREVALPDFIHWMPVELKKIRDVSGNIKKLKGWYNRKVRLLRTKKGP